MNIVNPDKEYTENRDDLYIKKIPRKKKIILKKPMFRVTFLNCF